MPCSHSQLHFLTATGRACAVEYGTIEFVSSLFSAFHTRPHISISRQQTLLRNNLWVISDKLWHISDAPTGLSVYDHLLTFSAEVEHVWSRKFGGATLVFYLNRYVPLADRFIVTAIMFTWNAKVIEQQP